MSPRLAFIPLTVAAVLLATSCEITTGIFYTLANETKIGDKNLDNELTVSSMVASAGAYYVAAGAIWAREEWQWCSCSDDDEHTWSLLANDHGEAALVTAMVATTFRDGDQIYAGFYFPDAGSAADRYGLFRWTSPGDLADATWSEVAITSASGTEQIVGLFLLADGEDGRLAVITAEDTGVTFDYSLHYSTDTDGTIFTAADFAGSTTVAQRPTAAVFDGSDRFFVVAGVEIYSGDITATLAQSTLAPHNQAGISQPPLGYVGMLASTGSQLYVSDRQGHLYRSGDGGSSWEQYPNTADDGSDQLEISSTVVQFTTFAQKGEVVFAGTEGYGYVSFEDATDLDETGVVRAWPVPADLSSAAVSGFSVPSGTSTLFVHTAGAGLWSSESNFSSTSINWLRE